MATAKPKPDDRVRRIGVYHAIGQLDAETIQARLQAAGIPAVIAYIKAAPPHAELGGVRVFVAEEHADAARALLKKTKGHRKAKSHGRA